MGFIALLVRVFMKYTGGYNGEERKLIAFSFYFFSSQTTYYFKNQQPPTTKEKETDKKIKDCFKISNGGWTEGILENSRRNCHLFKSAIKFIELNIANLVFFFLNLSKAAPTPPLTSLIQSPSPSLKVVLSLVNLYRAVCLWKTLCKVQRGIPDENIGLWPPSIHTLVGKPDIQKSLNSWQTEVRAIKRARRQWEITTVRNYHNEKLSAEEI